MSNQLTAKQQTKREDDVSRLVSVLYSKLHFHNLYAEASRRNDVMDALSFWSSKRPYGHKNIPVSIAFRLGWNEGDAENGHRLSDTEKEEAWELHELVKQEILEDKKFLEGIEAENRQSPTI